MLQLITWLLFFGILPAAIITIYNLSWDLRFWQKANYSFKRLRHYLWWDYELSHRDTWHTGLKAFLALVLGTSFLLGSWDLTAAVALLYYALIVNDSINLIRMLLQQKWPSLHWESTAKAVIFIHLFLILVLASLVGLWLNAQQLIGISFVHDQTIAVILPAVVIMLLVTAILDLGSSIETFFLVILSKPVSWLTHWWIVRQAKAKLAKMPQLKIVYITGSQGKTAVRKLLQNVLADDLTTEVLASSQTTVYQAAHFVLEHITLQTQVLILELNSYQLGDIRHFKQLAQPHVALITGISEAHIGLFGDMDHTLLAKTEVLSILRPDGVAVFNGSDENVRRLIQTHSNREIIYYPEENTVMLNDVDPILETIRLLKLDTEGRQKAKALIQDAKQAEYILEFQHEQVDYLPSMLATLAVGNALGLELDSMVAKVGLYANILFPWQELAGDFGSKLLIHEADSTYSNLLHSLDLLKNYNAVDKYLIIGGLAGFGGFKAKTYRNLADYINDSIDMLVTFDPLLAAAVGKVATRTEVILVRSMNHLIYEVRRRLEAGDLLLLHGKLDPSLIAELRSN